MTSATDLQTRLEEENRTALSRLGSSKSLYAATDGEIVTESVLQAAADAEYAAWQTLAAWADDEGNETARDHFETNAADEKRHYQTVSDRLEGYEPSETPALHQYLRSLESTPERLGGFLGRILASDRSKSQFVGFFVGDADPQTAALFREFGDDLEAQQERTLEALEEACASDDDWERAEAAGTDAIETAYQAYVESLEAMGANPKPVC